MNNNEGNNGGEGRNGSNSLPGAKGDTSLYNPLLNAHFMESIGFSTVQATSNTERLAALIYKFFQIYDVQPCGPLLVTLKSSLHPNQHRIQVDLYKLEKLVNLYFSVDQVATLKALQFTPKMVEDYLSAHLEDHVFEWATTSLKQKLAYDPNVIGYDTSSTFLNLVEALAGRPSGPRRELEVLLDSIVLETFVWSVKRKLYGLPVVEHIMPVIAGPLQGTGKSYLIERLFLAPLEKFVQLRSVDFVTDERNFKSLGHSLVVFFDEMARMGKADEESLKRVVSAIVLNYRPLHTNHTASVIQRNTFIGTSNKGLSELVKDTTGNRRFYEIPAGVINREIVNKINYLSLWQSVNEQMECPLYRTVWDGEKNVKVLNLIKGLQSEYQYKDSVTLFLEEEMGSKDSLLSNEAAAPLMLEHGNAQLNRIKSKLVVAPIKELYKIYTEYCQEAGYLNNNRYEILTRNKFTRALKNDLGVYIGRYSNDATVYIDKQKALESVGEGADKIRITNIINKLEKAQETDAKIVALRTQKR